VTLTRMSDADAAWLGMDAPDNLMMVTGVLRLQGRVDWSRLAEVVQQRMVARYPAFGRRAMPATSPFEQPVWSDDPEFALGDHLVHSALVTDTESGLADFISELLGTPLDMTRSPWQFHLIDGPTGDSTVVARLHHCIADGIALATVLLSLTDSTDSTDSTDTTDSTDSTDSTADPAPGAADHPLPGTRPSSASPRRPGIVRRVEDGASDVAAVTGVEIGAGVHPLRRAWSATSFGIGVVATGLRILFAARDPRTRLGVRLGSRKGAAWTRPLELDRLKDVSRALGVTLNDVLLAITAGALRRHLLANGERPHDLRIFMPVNLRPPGEPVPASLGNRFGLVFLSLPISVADAVERVRAVHERTRRLKAGREAAATFALMSIVGAVPVWGHRLAARVLGAKSSAIVTNVPGPRQPVSLAGAHVDRLMFWVPQAGSVGLGVSILSYAGTVTVGIAADRNVIEDPAELRDAVEAEVAELENRLR
jgi:diacylglycerol O-acyltransferase / wax synthase